MTLNLIQLVFAYMLAFFSIREAMRVRRTYKVSWKNKTLCTTLIVIGIVVPIITTSIFIERYM